MIELNYLHSSTINVIIHPVKRLFEFSNTNGSIKHSLLTLAGVLSKPKCPHHPKRIESEAHLMVATVTLISGLEDDSRCVQKVADAQEKWIRYTTKGGSIYHLDGTSPLDLL
ncbi:hypothetical protein AVEN_35798-1 [Araneus ventricosus]|uniref:Uncharacterized protein n=1 Tax=Araneus ventricosus TaxID=182803 RepID=A0A4Y2BJ35_ARAVE|nr:hypothetical protein AVEN_35798-1 [Araneus ventricosus]